jgi:hypothetical protein
MRLSGAMKRLNALLSASPVALTENRYGLVVEAEVGSVTGTIHARRRRR